MHLSSHQSRALGKVMRLLADAPADAGQLRQALALPLLDLLCADQYVSMVWNKESLRFEGAKAMNVSSGSLQRWDDYYRFIDPLTFAMMARQRPTIATQVISQSELGRTEFFNDFLRQEQMYWGINVYFFAQGACVGDIRVWRRQGRGNFGQSDIELLCMLEPAIAMALGRLAGTHADADAAISHSSAQELLQRHAGLSRREAEVAWWVACGLADKEIARRLGIGHATVRFHLANAFRKTHAGNRTLLVSRIHAILAGPPGIWRSST